MTKALPKPAHLRRRRPGYFHPVPVRPRLDGWTIWRQCEFLAQLYATGCVTTAARNVGMSRMAAYRLRAREEAESFAHAWDRVLTPPGTGRVTTMKRDWRKVTTGEVIRHGEIGLVQPVIYYGTMKGIRRKPDNSALLRTLRRLDKMIGNMGDDW